MRDPRALFLEKLRGTDRAPPPPASPVSGEAMEPFGPPPAPPAPAAIASTISDPLAFFLETLRGNPAQPQPPESPATGEALVAYAPPVPIVLETPNVEVLPVHGAAAELVEPSPEPPTRPAEPFIAAEGQALEAYEVPAPARAEAPRALEVLPVAGVGAELAEPPPVPLPGEPPPFVVAAGVALLDFPAVSYPHPF